MNKHLLARLGLIASARRARDAARRVLHPARETLLRVPDPLFLLNQGARLEPPYAEHLAALRREGITRLSGEIAPDTLRALQKGFQEKFIAPLDAGGRSALSYTGDVTLTDEYIDPGHALYVSNEPFMISRSLLEVSLKPELISLINAYLGKRAYITQATAARLLPHAQTGFGSFQWHHDAWGKRINMMIILTEVGEDDQHMTYAKGSHRVRHSYAGYLNSRISQEEYRERFGHLEVLNCLAKPGDIYIFDSNGVHSGNRTAGRVRDTVILEYTRNRHAVWAHRIPPEFLAGFSEEELRPLEWIFEVQRRKRSLVPPINSWVEGLLRPDKWSV